jgi:MFS transporter, ACS family, D-galactonate transporter
MATLLATGVLVAFLDRINLSVAAPQLAKVLAIDPRAMGYLLSAYLWPYTLLQIPFGILVDRLGAVRMGRWGSLLWTAASAVTAVASGFWGLFVARALLGVAEAPSFPNVSKATGHWFPRHERARATAMFDAAAKASNVVGVPLIAIAVVYGNWRWGFALTAFLSLIYCIAYWRTYHDPSGDPHLSEAERAYIRRGGAVPEGPSEAGALGMTRYLLGQRKVWGLAIGFGAYGYAFYLFLSWLPSYFVSTASMSVLRAGIVTAAPWAVGTATDLIVGGWLIDALIARGADETRVRKTVLVTGMLFGLAVIGVTATKNPVWATVWLCISMGGLGAAAPVGWSTPSLIAPKGGIGSVGGIMNFITNGMGIVAPIATGYIVAYTHSFAYAFLAAAVVLVVGILSFIFLLGRIEPLPEPPNPLT